MAKKNEYLECARAVGTHGVRGTVRLENMCDSASVLAGLHVMYRRVKGEYLPLTVINSSVQKLMVLTHFEGIDTLEDAVALKGVTFYAKRDDFQLDDGDFFIADLIGLPVTDIDSNEKYGTVDDVLTQGVQDIYIVKEESGKTFMIPAVPEFIKEVSLDGEGGVKVKLIEGMRK